MLHQSGLPVGFYQNTRSQNNLLNSCTVSKCNLHLRIINQNTNNMAIKVTVGQPQTQEQKPFPKLMICKSEDGDTIIYARCFKDGYICGTCIYTTHEDNSVSEYYERWGKSAFTDYNEPITLQNA